MPSASQLCSFPWDLYPYLQAHLLAHQQITLERPRAKAHVRTSVSPLRANTTNTQNSINNTRPTKLAKLSKSNCRTKKPRSGILSSAETEACNRVVEKFSENLPSNKLNAKRNLLLKISHSQTLKLLNEHVRNLLLKIIRTTNLEQLFFKLRRNERISR